MRASRLISILLLLQTRGRITAQELAGELEVSVRTVYRDVEELSASGIPIYAERGSHGGFQLVEGYRTRLTGLTPEEAEALFLSGYPGPAAQLGLGTVLAAAQLKVLAALPPELRSRASRIRQRFHLDAPGWFQESESAAHLQPIAEAVWSDRRLHMHYRRVADDGEVVERVVDPLGLVLKGGIWYLVARADTTLRTYRVSRILDLDLLDGRFLRPDDFELADYWQRSVAAYEESMPSFEAVLRVRPERLWRLEEALGVETAKAAIAAAGDADESGWLTLRLTLEDVAHAEPKILMLGADAEVVEPAELRHRIAAVAGEMAARYG
ncbi:MAG: YafY family protein [Candidatus Limnocylindrales bacterium]|jgi:predicted DNA-binding transcriptional regulator YafY